MIASILADQMSGSGGKGARASSPMSAACVALARIAARTGDPSEGRPATTPGSSVPASGPAKETPVVAPRDLRQDAGLPDIDRGSDAGKAQRHKVVLRQDGTEREFSGGIPETVREMAAKSLSASTIPGFPTEAQIREFQRLVEEGGRTDGVDASDASGLDDLGLLDELDRLGRTSEGASTPEEGDAASPSAVPATDGERAQVASGGDGTRAASSDADILSILYGDDEDEEE